MAAGDAPPQAARRFEECRLWDAGQTQWVQCVLTAEVVLLCGEQPEARYREQFDLIPHGDRAVLLGRHGSDDNRTIMFADVLFRTTVVVEDRPGPELPQRRIKFYKCDVLGASTALSQHNKWVGDPSSNVGDSKVMSVIVQAPATAEKVVDLEWFFSLDPRGAQPAITAMCSAASCLEYVWSRDEVNHNFRRANLRLQSLRAILEKLSLPGSGAVDSWRAWRRDSSGNGDGQHDPDLGPRECTLSASSLCLLLAHQADSAYKERWQPGIGARSSKLLSAITTRIFHPLTLRIVAAPSQCILQIDHGSVDLRELGRSEAGAMLCSRTGVPKPSTIEHAKIQEAPRCA